MTEPPQTSDMDATQIAERHVIERYLANQLSDAEADAFEAYVEAHPEMTRQIELVARMKSGLGVLRRRGELQSVLNAPLRSWRRQPAFLVGVAASLALLSFFVFRFMSAGAAPPLLATSLEQLRSTRDETIQLGTALALVRARGVGSGGVIELPEGNLAAFGVELTLVTGEAAPPKGYEVEILRLADGALEPVARLSELEVNADGNLHVFLRASALGAGEFLIRLTTAGSETPIEYSLRVTRSSS